MDGTPIYFAGASAVTVGIAATMSKASAVTKVSLVAAGAVGTWASYKLVRQKKRKEAYLIAVFVLIMALISLGMFTKADRAHFSNVVRSLNN